MSGATVARGARRDSFATVASGSPSNPHLCYGWAMVTRLTLLLALTLTACGDSSGGTTTEAYEPFSKGLGEACVDEPGLESECKQGLTCIGQEYPCNVGYCTLDCSSDNDCPSIDGSPSYCQGDPRVCVFYCGEQAPMTGPASCPASFSQNLTCNGDCFVSKTVCEGTT